MGGKGGVGARRGTNTGQPHAALTFTCVVCECFFFNDAQDLGWQRDQQSYPPPPTSFHKRIFVWLHTCSSPRPLHNSTRRRRHASKPCSEPRRHVRLNHCCDRIRHYNRVSLCNFHRFVFQRWSALVCPRHGWEPCCVGFQQQGPQL